MKTLRIIAGILLVLHMALIFSLSSQTANESSKTSGNLIRAVVEFVYPDFEDLEKDEQEAIIEKMQYVVRKGAHFSAFFLLGVLAFFEFLTYRGIPYVWRIIISLLFCLVYAITDEYHQKFVPGRSCMWQDVIIDCSGALLAIVIISAYVRCKGSLYDKTKKPEKTVVKGGKKLNKKKLISQNTELWERLNQSQTEAIALKEEIESKDEAIKGLEEKITALQTGETSEPLKSSNEKVATQTMPNSFDYLANIIGKILLEAEKYCNELKELYTAESIREHINLILGRAEVAKAEIIRILSADINDEEKYTKADKEYKDAVEYFEIVMAQCK